MIISIRGKLAEQAMTGRFGKGFPADLVKRTRAMLWLWMRRSLRIRPGHLEALR